MRILLLCHSFNSLTQRFLVELRERGEEVSVEFDISDAVLREALELFAPDLVLAPFLKRAIPEDVLARVKCLIVHPGPPGDRGPSALDWAILEGRDSWGVTLLEAAPELDAGPVWATRGFAMRAASKSSHYRHEVTRGAVACVIEALEKICAGERPRAQTEITPMRPSCPRALRRIDWAADDVAVVLRKIRSADGSPGAPGAIAGRDYLLFDAEAAHDLPAAEPGTLLARRGEAVAVAARGGAVWIGHLREPAAGSLKLPAAHVLHAAATLPEKPSPLIRYAQEGEVGCLHFVFYNGAMSVADCGALEAAILSARRENTRVLVLAGGPDYWSNGLHLGVIEAANSAAEESLRNIEAMNDCVRALLDIDDRLVVAALRGNAGAGGVFLALAADVVMMREGVILNPHYKDMGNLWGSEYWTYLLPRRVGAEKARLITQNRLPMGAAQAVRLGLADIILPEAPEQAETALRAYAQNLAAAPDFAERLAAKRVAREKDEAAKPLENYRAEELEKMRRNFFGFDPSYHVARHNFIRKVAKSRTPLHLALHRSLRQRRDIA
jgi:putative two-component system hydrogenase maturation factor HypX/HoxX